MINKILQHIRVEFELSQTQLADIAGVSRFTILNWERGHTTPQPDKLKKIEDAVNVKVNSARFIYDSVVSDSSPTHQTNPQPMSESLSDSA